MVEPKLPRVAVYYAQHDAPLMHMSVTGAGALRHLALAPTDENAPADEDALLVDSVDAKVLHSLYVC